MPGHVDWSLVDAGASASTNPEPMGDGRGMIERAGEYEAVGELDGVMEAVGECDGVLGGVGGTECVCDTELVCDGVEEPEVADDVTDGVGVRDCDGVIVRVIVAVVVCDAVKLLVGDVVGEQMPCAAQMPLEHICPPISVHAHVAL